MERTGRGLRVLKWTVISVCILCILLAGFSRIAGDEETPGRGSGEEQQHNAKIMRVKLMHRNHHDSPFRKPGETRLESLRSLFRQDKLRLASFSRSLESLSSHEEEPETEAEAPETEEAEAPDEPGPGEAPENSNPAEAIWAPIFSGSFVGAGQYFVDVQIGTPPKRFLLIADTGSDLVWVNCRYSSTGADATLVKEQPLVLKYHDGPLLSTKPIDIHVIWYGKFSPVQRSIVADYLQSLGAKLQGKGKQPSVSTWWKTIEKYKSGTSNEAPLSIARLGKQKMDNSYSLGKLLKRTDIATLVESAIKSRALSTPARHRNAMYLVLTSEDVAVERFCMSSCGYHGHTLQSRLPYAWVGNAVSQCPGQCAWPFHQPLYGPQTPPLLSPNADVGIDGMIINIASVVAGAVTNPFNTGYFQGDAGAPLEAVSACPGMFRKGAYSGFPGELLVDKTTGSSYNAHGLNGRQFLLPAMWDPATKSCTTLV